MGEVTQSTFEGDSQVDVLVCYQRVSEQTGQVKRTCVGWMIAKSMAWPRVVGGLFVLGWVPWLRRRPMVSIPSLPGSPWVG